VAPTLAGVDAAYNRRLNAVESRDGGLRFAKHQSPSDVAYRVIRKFGAPHVGAARNAWPIVWGAILPASRNLVGNVVGVRASNKVRWVATRWIVATMSNHESPIESDWIQALGVRIGDAVSLKWRDFRCGMAAARANPSVPVRVNISGPRPALISAASKYEGSESFGKRSARFSHGSYFSWLSWQ